MSKQLETNRVKKLRDGMQEKWRQLCDWFEKESRARLIFLIAALEIEILIFIYIRQSVMDISNCSEFCQSFFKSPGIWTFMTLLISSPIAFAIWHFRDANTQQQIANQRKDVNLKEFQKIAEWVSGAHLVEEELTEKTKTISKRTEQESSTEQETTREYSRQPEKQNITTFSKQDGAVGLQIAAVYMLLPFYRGDHGEDFRRPAFNLLTAAWLSLFSKVDDIETGQELAKQPLAVAITEVLFAEGGLVYSTEAKYEHLLVNLYLPFVNLNMSGLSEKASKVFVGKNCQGIDLHGALLREAHFEGANLEGAHFEEANLMLAHFEKSGLEVTNLRNAHFEGANLRKAHFEGANLVLAHFEKSNLKVTDLRNAYFEGAILADAHFKEANLNGANLNRVNFLKWAHFEGADLFGAQLTESDCKQLPSSISQTQRYDLIVLSLVESPSVQVYQLTATKKIRNRRGDGIEHKIFGCQLNEQKTKELNQANWDIKIKELPPTSQQP